MKNKHAKENTKTVLKVISFLKIELTFII